jgi:predicted dehydrogenase
VNALSDDFELTHVLQRSSKDALKQHPKVTVVSTPQELFSSDVELVIVTTPPESHYELVRDALVLGKHVVCEKPFTATLAQAENLVKIAKTSRGILSVYHNRRWDGDLLTVKMLMEKNVLGRVVNFESRMDRYKPYRQVTGSRAWKEQDSTAGGLLYDLGSHLVDQVLHIFGKPSSIHANILHQRDRTSVSNDFFSITMDYSPEGPLVHVQAGSLVRDGFSPRFRIDGTLGSFTKFGVDVQEAQIRDLRMSPLSASYGVDVVSGWAQVDTEADGLRYVGRVETVKGDYLQFYKKLANAIRKGDKGLVGVTPEDALDVMRVLEAAKRSSEENRVVEFE